MPTCRQVTQVRLAGQDDGLVIHAGPELSSAVLPGGGSKASAASKRIYQRAEGAVFPQLCVLEAALVEARLSALEVPWNKTRVDVS